MSNLKLFDITRDLTVPYGHPMEDSTVNDWNLLRWDIGKNNADLVCFDNTQMHGILQINAKVDSVNFFRLNVDKPFYLLVGEAVLYDIENSDEFLAHLQKQIHQLSLLTRKKVQNNILVNDIFKIKHALYKRTPVYTPHVFTSHELIRCPHDKAEKGCIDAPAGGIYEPLTTCWNFKRYPSFVCNSAGREYEPNPAYVWTAEGASLAHTCKIEETLRGKTVSCSFSIHGFLVGDMVELYAYDKFWKIL